MHCGRPMTTRWACNPAPSLRLLHKLAETEYSNNDSQRHDRRSAISSSNYIHPAPTHTHVNCRPPARIRYLTMLTMRNHRLLLSDPLDRL